MCQAKNWHSIAKNEMENGYLGLTSALKNIILLNQSLEKEIKFPLLVHTSDSQSGVILSSRKHLTMSGDIFSYHNLGEVLLLVPGR